jgi:hypothetical protein
MCLAAGALLAGCSRDAELGFTVRTLPSVSDDQAAAAAELAFQEHFRIDRPLAGGQVVLELRSVPQDREQLGGTGRLRDEAVQHPNRVRRIALLRLLREAGRLQAHCQVLLERQDTADVEMFRQDRRREDTPTYTPLDSESATPEQNAVWTVVGRDAELEREIVASLIERLTPTEPGEPSPTD